MPGFLQQLLGEGRPKRGGEHVWEPMRDQHGDIIMDGNNKPVMNRVWKRTPPKTPENDARRISTSGGAPQGTPTQDFPPMGGPNPLVPHILDERRKTHGPPPAAQTGVLPQDYPPMGGGPYSPEAMAQWPSSPGQPPSPPGAGARSSVAPPAGGPPMDAMLPMILRMLQPKLRQSSREPYYGRMWGG